MLTPTIETERLLLRGFEESDLEAFYDMIQDIRLQEFIEFPKLTKEEELSYIRECIQHKETDKYEKWAIVLKDSKETIGNITINEIHKKHHYCDIGYVIRYPYWGNGYAKEALVAVTNYLLESNYHLVECTCNERNIKSIRTLEKAGFKKDASLPNRRLNKDGSYSKVEYYSKTK